MPKPCKFAITMDGRRYGGEWTLKLGDRMLVTSFWGHEIVDLDGARPEACAPWVLERIVRGWRRERADHLRDRGREMAKIRRLNERERRP